MKKPKEIKKCPFCEKKKVELIIEKIKHIVKTKNYIIDSNWWKYHCKNCGEKFTSTQSDEISMKYLQRKLI